MTEVSTQIRNVIVPTERRFVSVIMCDLVGSTALSDSLDPEIFGNLVERAINLCVDHIEKNEGYVSAYQGDSIIALFGYPMALEKHAVRAVRTGIDIARAMTEQKDTSLAMRIGIASGTTVISPVHRRGSITQIAAHGYVPNLAGRLQAIAKKNTVFVDHRTYRQTRQFFEFTDQGEHRMKGFSQPKRVWCAGQEFETPKKYIEPGKQMLGRLKDEHHLYRLIDNATSSIGGFALITGEPGVGKSRLMSAGIQYCKERVKLLELHCSDLRSQQAFHPFKNIVNNYLKPSSENTEENTQLKLQQLAKSLKAECSIILPVLQMIAGVKMSDKIDDSPQATRQIEKSLVALINGHNDTPTQVLFIEDIHWLDTATLAVLVALRNSSPSVLIVATSRGPFAHPNLPCSDEISLTPLSITASRQLVEQISGPTIPERMKDEILERSEGLPLFIEELVQSAGTLLKSNNERLSDQELIPDTLQFSLLTRIDALGQSKRLLSIAAMIGREFDYELTSAISGLSIESIDSSVDNLTDQNIFISIDSNSPQTLSFRHALIQEAAASLIPKTEKKTIHSAIADELLLSKAEEISSNPITVARHLKSADRFDEAVNYFHQAASLTARTAAKLEAADQFKLAISCLKKCTQLSHNAMLAEELKLQSSHGHVLYSALGHATDESMDAFNRAIAISRTLGDTDAQATVLDGLFGIHFNSAEFDEAENTCRQLLKLSAETGKVSQAALATQGVGMCNFNRGNLATAESELKSALGFLSEAKSINSDFPSMTYLYLSWTQLLMDDKDAANDNYDLGCRYADGGSPYNIAAALGNGCHLYQWQNQPEKVANILETLIPLCKEQGFIMWGNLADFFDSWVEVTRSSGTSGLSSMHKVFDKLTDEIEKTYYLGMLAKSNIIAGNLTKAGDLICRALSQADRHNEHYYTPELLRLQATLCQNEKQQIYLLQRARDLAHTQQAGFWIKRIDDDLSPSNLHNNKRQTSLHK